MTAYVVLIHSKGRKVMSSHAELQDAFTAALGESRRSGAIIVRDGVTGRRYSVVEIEQRILKPVTLKSSWAQILGVDAQAATEPQRRSRWAKWLRIVRATSDGKPMARAWVRDVSECSGCIHARGGWCRSMGLPCTVNPILTMRHGAPGMACMGMGKTYASPTQLGLFA